jgi:predicted amino acid-binding ACT domain protein
MALKVNKVDVWAGDLNDVPGGLADVLERVSAGGGSIQFIIARRSDKHPGAGKVFLTPVAGPRVKDAAGRSGLQHATGMGTLRIEGPDAKGLGAKITRAIADAGINIRGVSAAVIGNRFVAYIGLDSNADADAAARALKGVRAGGGSGGAKRGASRTRKRTTAKRSKSRR